MPLAASQRAGFFWTSTSQFKFLSSERHSMTTHFWKARDTIFDKKADTINHRIRSYFSTEITPARDAPRSWLQSKTSSIYPQGYPFWINTYRCRWNHHRLFVCKYGSFLILGSCLCWEELPLLSLMSTVNLPCITVSNSKRDLDSHLTSRSVCIFRPRLVYIPELSLIPRQVPDFNEQTSFEWTSPL